ncbi:MAG: hypothetical protein ACLQE9_12865 [Roseiarcus sp.]
MHRYKLSTASAPFLVFLALMAGQSGQGLAADQHIFVIAAAEGYGVEDCLAEGGDCGHVVADAWCEAHGHGAAISFGLADDVTGAISLASAGAKAQRPYFVRCGD